MADLSVRVGDTAPIVSAVLQSGGTPITIPTGATVTFTLTNSQLVQVFSAAAVIVDPTQTTDPGHVTYTWAAGQTAALGGGNYTGRFILTSGSSQQTFPAGDGITIELLADSAAPPISLNEVLAHLNYRFGVVSDNPEIEGFLEAAVSVIEHEVGPITPRTITGEQHDGGSATIVLRRRPVLTVTSVDEYQNNTDYPLTGVPTPQTASVYSFTFDQNSGTVTRRGTGGYPIPFREGPGNVIVTYVAGRASLPPNIRLAILELVSHTWQRSQQSAGGKGGFLSGSPEYDASDPAPGSFAGIPYRVLELLAGSRVVPGIA